MPSESLERSLSSGAQAGSMPKAWQNRSHSSSGAAPVGGTVTTCTRSGGRLRDQLLSTVGRSKARMNQVLAALGLVEEPLEPPAPALLDALLPGGRQLAGQVAHAVDDVDLAALEVVHQPGDLLRRRRREDLVADDRRCRWTGGSAGQLAARRRRVPRRTAPVLVEQVERAAEVRQRGRGEPGSRARARRARRAGGRCGRAGPGGTSCRSSAPRCAGGRWGRLMRRRLCQQPGGSATGR